MGIYSVSGVLLIFKLCLIPSLQREMMLSDTASAVSGEENVHSRSEKRLCLDNAENVDVMDDMGKINELERNISKSSSAHSQVPFGKWENLTRVLKKYAQFIGPGLMITVAYIDPGNYSTAVSAGASNEYSLLFVTLLSNCIANFLQCLCIKLGSVTGYDLSRSCREYLPKWLNYILYVFSEAAIIATDIAEVIGTAIALKILFRIPLPAGVALTVLDVFIVMFFYKPGSSSLKFIRIFEYCIAGLVFAVFICFIMELAYLPSSTSVSNIFRGFVPQSQMFDNNGMYTAISILGATVMPHSLFLGSGIVQPRLIDYDVKHGNYSITDEDQEGEKTVEEIREKKYFAYQPSMAAINYCMKYSIIELVLTLFTIALFVNCAILIVAGATLYGSEEAQNADLFTIHNLLSSTLSPGAGTIFILALLFSGQSAGIVCTMAGQIVSEGHLNWKMTPWKRRIVTRSISIIPCLAISIALGREAMSKALNASQVVLSILLPFLVAPLVYFTSSKAIMQRELIVDDTSVDESDHEGNIDCSSQMENLKRVKIVNMANGWIVTIISVLLWIFLTMLNIYAIVELGISHGDISG